MKKIYNPENIERTLSVAKNKLKVFYNKNCSIKEIVNAFNKLPAKYQDLLLKPDKDENDKAELTKVYDSLRRTILISKNISDDIKINIKNINEEEVEKKNDYSMEDVEHNFEQKEVTSVFKEDKPLVIPSAIKDERHNSRIFKKEPEKERPEEIILRDYIKERKNISVEELLDSLDIPEEDKYIILVKFEDNSVKPNETVSKEIGISSSYINEVVDRFYSLAIEEKKKKIYTFERK